MQTPKEHHERLKAIFTFRKTAAERDSTGGSSTPRCAPVKHQLMHLCCGWLTFSGSRSAEAAQPARTSGVSLRKGPLQPRNENARAAKGSIRQYFKAVPAAVKAKAAQESPDGECTAFAAQRTCKLQLC